MIISVPRHRGARERRSDLRGPSGNSRHSGIRHARASAAPKPRPADRSYGSRGFTSLSGEEDVEPRAGGVQVAGRESGRGSRRPG